MVYSGLDPKRRQVEAVEGILLWAALRRAGCALRSRGERLEVSPRALAERWAHRIAPRRWALYYFAEYGMTARAMDIYAWWLQDYTSRLTGGLETSTYVRRERPDLRRRLVAAEAMMEAAQKEADVDAFCRGALGYFQVFQEAGGAITPKEEPKPRARPRKAKRSTMQILFSSGQEA